RPCAGRGPSRRAGRGRSRARTPPPREQRAGARGSAAPAPRYVWTRRAAWIRPRSVGIGLPKRVTRPFLAAQVAASTQPAVPERSTRRTGTLDSPYPNARLAVPERSTRGG